MELQVGSLTGVIKEVATSVGVQAAPARICGKRPLTLAGPWRHPKGFHTACDAAGLTPRGARRNYEQSARLKEFAAAVVQPY
jgi:hypothetical protein